jgi:tetratricopeptide (TPR) repeat protein
MSVLNKIRNRILGLLLLVVVVSNAQPEKVDVAYDFYTKHVYDSAKANIDIAILDPVSANDPSAWQIRGYIYKDLYNKNEKGDKMSLMRIEALNSFRKSLLLDKNKEYLQENIAGMKYLVNTMHNDAAESLDPMDYETAIQLFRKEQEYFKIIDPSSDSYQSREIEFGTALGSVYMVVIESSKDSLKTVKYINLAKNVYTQILSMEPNNITANYNLGILYYNQAVNLIKSQPYDADLEVLDRVQDQSVKLFKASLPFMEKAYSLDPKRVDALEGLSGIYFGLNEPEKSNIYRQRLQDIKKNKK